MHTWLWFLIGGYLLGVLWRSFFIPDLYAVLALTISTTSLLALARVTPGMKHVTLYVALTLLALVLGVARTELADRSFERGLVYAEEERVDTTAQVVTEADVRDVHTIITLQLERSEAHTRVRVHVPHYPALTYGDRVRVTGTIKRPAPFETETGRVFDYRTYLQKDHIQYEMHFAEVTLLERGAGNKLVQMLLGIKAQWLNAVARIIPEPSASLLGGVVVGAKQSLGAAWLEKFRDTGLVHIVVLSGYNLTIVAVFIVWMASRLSRGARFILGTLGIVCFALMTGAGPTVVRASIMAIFALLAQVLTRPYVVLRGLALAGFCMVLWNPYVLAFDPGFQLSFIATLGLVLGSPVLEPRLTLVPKFFGLRTIVAATLATQIAVLPMLLYQIGEVSLVAPVVNLLVLPLVPLLMAVGFAAGVVGMASTTLALPLAALTHALLAYVFWVVDLFADLSWTTVLLPSVSILVVMILYAALFGIVRVTQIRP